jgi:hydroxyacylglutathione hydrolase
MYIEQLYTGCLAEAAYYIESNGEAAIVDPLRDPTPYLQLAKERNANIKYVFETHFHADFVSGHIDLAKIAKAEIIYGPLADANYSITVAEDEQEFPLGDCTIKVLHTPGHTTESSCFLLKDGEGNDHALFSGDTLFIGDVGRPDLAVSNKLTKENLAGLLYDSIKDKILPLSDNVILYPGHGAGSQCGKNLSSETVSTIGEQKLTNYALNTESKSEFIRVVTENLAAPPQYFPKNAQINKLGYPDYDLTFNMAYNKLGLEELASLPKDTLFLDTRDAKEFCANHITGSINVSLNGSFAVWVGTLISNINTPIVLICESGTENESILRLLRVGYENIIGFVNNAFDNDNYNKLSYSSVETLDFDKIKSLENVSMVDVRNESEYDEFHLETAVNIPLNQIERKLDEFDSDKSYIMYCKTGYRSAIACSMLKRAGYKNVMNLNGGIAEFHEVLN